APLPHLERTARDAPARLFDHVGDADLRRLGVDEQTLAFARAITDPVQLDAAKAFLPPTQWDVLFGLAAGYSPEEVWEELGAAITAGERVDPDDIGAAVRRSRDRIVLVDGPEELMAVFAHPFALWRVYLHPVQRGVVEARYRGPARVTGGPGTGKTVVALHRAHHLAVHGEGRVLVTTFTSTLAESLRAGMRLLADSDDVADRVEVTHVDQLAHRVFREAHGAPALLDDRRERELWTSITRDLDVPFTPAFLAEEWRQVVLAQRVRSAQDYLAAKRTGRGRALGSRQRAQVWQAIWEFEAALRERGLWTHETVRVEAARILGERADKPYRHVVVDEAQDLSPEQWRLLRAAVPEGPDDLFFAADTHQRIYQHRVSLRDVGVNVTGRSARLRVNYRTTAEILAWSLELLRGERIDDMDGGLDSIAGCRSEVRGPAPTVRGFAARDAELRHLAETVRGWLDAGVAPDEIGVAVRFNRLAGEVVAALEAESVPARLLAGGRPAEDAVSVGTMHRMKGLEFRCLAVAGVSEGQIPATNAVTPEAEDEAAHRADLQRERCLLFVACTRARERLHVTWSREPSPFLPSPA
ncbi:UvrD-helicase domain-containing protein, partial [Thermobifida halotolerans]|uniref:UvrD-helicase domain-containing protein n=1 Tax=Thermobifida halotolerans TaxID=483545 RepID=UPI001F2B68EF